MHGVDADGLRAEFDGEGPHQPDHSMFGRHVVAGVRVCLQTRDRTGQDDRAASAAGQQMRDAGLHRLPHPAEVDVDHLLPDVFLHPVEPSSDSADACVGDDDVQPAELLDAAVDGGLERVVIADVDLGGDDPPVQRLDQIGCFREVLGGRRRGRRVGEPKLIIRPPPSCP